MPDVQLLSTQINATGFQAWDFLVEGNIVPFISPENEPGQRAAVCAYLQRDSVKQLPGIGVPWLEFLTGQADIAEADAAVRGNINLHDLPYKPNYEIANGNILVKVVSQ